MNKERTGQLFLSRVQEPNEGQDETFMLSLIDIVGGHMLETSRELTEAEVRDLLKENYGESESEIQQRLQSARAKPAI